MTKHIEPESASTRLRPARLRPSALRASALRASALAVLLLGTVLAAVTGAPTLASAQTGPDTTTDDDTVTDTTVDDADPNTDPTADPNADPDAEPEPIVRQFTGEDRFETAASLATVFAERTPTSSSVILAGGNLIDAAAASGFSRATSAPVLLTPSDRLLESTKQFIKDQQIATVYLLGGENAISAAVEAELRALTVSTAEELAADDPAADDPAAEDPAAEDPAAEDPAAEDPAAEPAAEPVPLTVHRIAGDNRYQTSVLLALQVGSPGFYCSTEQPTAVLVNVDNTFADVIAVGPLAYSLRFPVLLTSAATLPAAVREYLRGPNVERVLIVGGEAAVSADVEAEVRSEGIEDVVRLAGNTRYDTALDIRELLSRCPAIEISPSTLSLINGNDAASGISAGPLLGAGLGCNGVTPVLLVEADRLPDETRQYLDYAKGRIVREMERDPEHPGVFITAIGDESLVSDAVVREAAATADVAITQGTVAEQETCLLDYYTAAEGGTFEPTVVDERPPEIVE